MGNNLKDAEFANQFQMPDDKEQEADMKDHEKDPEQRIVSSNGGKNECIVQCPQPVGALFRIDLKGRWILRFAKELYESYNGTQKEDRKGKVYHWYQNDIVDSLHGSPLSIRLDARCPLAGAPENSPMPSV